MSPINTRGMFLNMRGRPYLFSEEHLHHQLQACMLHMECLIPWSLLTGKYVQ